MPHSKMGRIRYLVLSVCLLQAALAVKVKVVMHSDQEDSKMEEEESTHTEPWDHKKRLDVTMLPFLKTRKHGDDKQIEFDEEKTTTEKQKQQHPNEMIFPLIYHQSHVNSMFKFGENWYTWSTEKRTDGSKAINYYICYDEPKRCDDIGWERTDALPKCAFQIDSLLPEDRACINSFGVEPHSGGICDGAEQMKVAEIVRACGPRIRSLWRFVRVGRRPANAAKPADVNSLICEDEEECFITIEYRIHHDRITFSLHEPTRGQTFKSVLKRETPVEEEKVSSTTEVHPHVLHRKKVTREEEPPRNGNKKFHLKSKSKAEGKGIVKERNDSGTYGNRRAPKNKIKVREDLSEDISD
ncbi:unnamed protein product [Spodoptera littoralis]|uniref:Uncharacterized protein n=1 Tax=Spodoptera littoralis TaxID=7109 RepID=A0A9P0IJU3_SPOLI|nr:unnamed protein product [Spodoptera littoralis]CAH1647512.1 unnamed protein product [Spodoptera littoralis]